jgi:glucose-1-phosphate thymidylyltransferase
MKGILLAGGVGSRLWPITRGLSKQLLPVYDKPMVYYPLGTLMLAGIREIALITTPEDQESFKRLLKDGKQWGIEITYLIQEKPNGIAESFLIAENFILNSSVALILGDNIFNGSGIGRNLQSYTKLEGAQIFAYQVANPEDFGVVELDHSGNPVSLIEKPKNSKSGLAVPGLYFYGPGVVAKAKKIERSARGELEITTLNADYLKENSLKVTVLPRGTAWLDAGTPETLYQSGAYIQTVQERQGIKVGCIEEECFKKGFMSNELMQKRIDSLPKSEYKTYLQNLIP